MKKLFFICTLISFCNNFLYAQDTYKQIDVDGNITTSNIGDSTKQNKEVPKGLKEWTVNKKFGDRTPIIPDTLMYMFMNTDLMEGMYGNYNTTGYLGSPRINRIFAARPQAEQFIFTQPFDYFIIPIDKFRFTNTLSPLTTLSYNTCGNRTNGEDHFKARFAVNAGKRLGFGMIFNYLYGRGYYQNQSTSHFDYTMYSSYIGDKYQNHILISTNHQKVTENGGITNDNYITHPESFNEDFQTNEIPTVLQENWNRNDNQHFFLTQRYSLGFSRKVKMTKEEIKAKKFALASKEAQNKRKAEKEYQEKPSKERKRYKGRPENAQVSNSEFHDYTTKNKEQRIKVNSKTMADSLIIAEKKQKEDDMWIKNEYVPVTNFIHTLKLDNCRRIYEAYKTPNDFYAQKFNTLSKLPGDSIYDNTNMFRIQNTFAISLLEGFNKWAKVGIKGFVTSDLRRFKLPKLNGGTDTYNEHNLSIGGEISKTEGKTLHYRCLAESWLVGNDIGQLKLDFSADVNFKLFGDTLTLATSAFLHRLNPTFYFRHYHSRHLWWDNTNLDKIFHSRIEGTINYDKTNTSIRISIDEIKNYTYFEQLYEITPEFHRINNLVNPNQHTSPITVLTATLRQKFNLGPVHWDSQITYQNSTNKEVLPVPTLNLYSNLFLRFKIAGVLKCDLGTDVRYFTKYYAPDYSPTIGQFTVNRGNEKIKIGNYPYVNIYANFHLKHTRFFVMMSHINSNISNNEYFLTPHYPTNKQIFRFGLSWDFFN